jgi:hypothetical protein
MPPRSRLVKTFATRHAKTLLRISEADSPCFDPVAGRHSYVEVGYDAIAATGLRQIHRFVRDLSP